MTDPAQTQATVAVAIVPTPSSIRPERAAQQAGQGTRARR